MAVKGENLWGAEEGVYISTSVKEGGESLYKKGRGRGNSRWNTVWP